MCCRYYLHGVQPVLLAMLVNCLKLNAGQSVMLPTAFAKRLVQWQIL